MNNIADWLSELGLSEHIHAFEENEVGLADLPNLDKADLLEMGVGKVGHRNRILKAISALETKRSIEERQEFDRFPSILAVSMAEYTREQTPVMKLWHACDSVELLLRLVVMLGISELRAKGLLSGKVLRELKPRIEEPTLGKWKGMAIAVADTLPVDSVFPELMPLVRERMLPFLEGNEQDRSSQNSFSALRNQLAHGGGITQSAARKLLGCWESRVKNLFESLGWLGSVHFVALNEGELIELCGSDVTQHPVFRAERPGIQDQVVSELNETCSVVIVRGESVFSLWPLSLFGLPRSLNIEDQSAENAVSQIYVRRGDVRLQYTPIGSEEVCQSESEEEALKDFEQLFLVREAQSEKRRYEVRGFEQEIERDASRLIGRQREIITVQNALRQKDGTLLWLSGPAGMGKSYLMARIASEILSDPPEGSLVLAYRFKAGDDRCSRNRFIHFAIERLLFNLYPMSERALWLQDNRKLQPIAQLKNLLENLTDRTNVFIILDGMDEIIESDASFVDEVVVGLALPSTIWLCAGRPERGLPKIFADAEAIDLFENGLPPMGYADVRSMLLEKIGPLRKRLVQQDSEDREGQIMNPFVKRVLENAKGLPIYVTYVTGDILANRYRHLDGKEQLPPSLEKYHEELLRRCSVGVLHQVVSPMAATIAVARESLTAPALGSILYHNNTIPDDEEPVPLVNRGISAIASMLRRSTTPEDDEGYTLFHHSLRQHMLSSPETKGILKTAEKNLAVMVSDIPAAGPAKNYLLRWGISHLLKVRPTLWQDMLHGLLVEAGVMDDKIACQPLEDFLYDYVQVYAAAETQPSEEILKVLSNLALQKLSNNEWELEQIHSLLVHRRDQRFYRSFLEFITKQNFPEGREYQLVISGFKARLANLLRREGVEYLLDAETLLKECLEELQANGGQDSVLERSRLQYDLAYIMGFLRGRVEESLAWFDKSIQSSRDGGNEVGANISTIARVQTEFYYGKVSADSFYSIIESSKPVFVSAAEQGDENGKRWIMNVHAHLFYASFTKGEVDSARKYYVLLEDDPWFVRFGCEDSLLPNRARMAMLTGSFDRAVGHFQNYFAEGPRLEQVVISSIYLDYGYALQRAERIEDAMTIWNVGLKAHDDFGNRPWKQAIKSKMKAAQQNR